MTASPADRTVSRRVAGRRGTGTAAVAIALALALGGAASPAFGQGAPIPLLPGAAPQPTTAATPQPTIAATPAAVAPSRLPPSRAPLSPAAESLPEGATPAAARIQVQDLAVPDPGATGLLDEPHGGLPLDMWNGTSLPVVEKILPLLPAPTPWRSVRQLERKLLLSSAQPPAGPGGGQALLGLRAEKLWALGEVNGLVGLLKLLPSPAMTPELRRLQADAALLGGDTATACQQVGPLKVALTNDPWPAKLDVFCRFASGKANEAALGVEVLREQKVTDLAFFRAADVLTGLPPAKAEGGMADTPLNLAMTRLAKLPVPEQAVGRGLAAPLLAAIATLPDATAEARLVAAERGEAVGAVDTETLRQLYQAVPFTAQELAAPPGEGSAAKAPRGRALAYQTAQQQATPAAKAEVIAKALAAAGDPLSYAAAARLYAPQIAAIPPSPELSGFAVAAARALFAAGQPAAAKPWIELLRSQGQTVESAAAGAAVLWPLARLAAVDGAAPASGPLTAWRRTPGELASDAGQRRAAVVLELLAALGDPVSADDWLALTSGAPLVAAPVPRPALWQGLRIAAEQQRQGAAVLFALASLGDLTQVDPSQLYRVVAALHQVGLDADARALAVEAAIANGV
jgi:hypothetical protein